MGTRHTLDLEQCIATIVGTQLLAMGLAGCGCPTLPDDYDPTSATSLTPEDLSGEGGGNGGGDVCRSACTPTDAFQAALDAGFRDSELETSCFASGDTVTCTVTTDCSAGRRPGGWRAPAAHGAGVGGWWARMAMLEAASVQAFEELASDLDRLGAPVELSRAARAASEDEQRHAALCGAMARRHGAHQQRVVPASRSLPDLHALALDNAAEGCVREAFGALVAHWQARTATDARAGAVLLLIARDETRHGQLSMVIDAWARSLLPPETAVELDRARDEALSRLREELSTGRPLAALGLPSSSVGLALLEAFSASAALAASTAVPSSRWRHTGHA